MFGKSIGAVLALTIGATFSGAADAATTLFDNVDVHTGFPDLTMSDLSTLGLSTDGFAILDDFEATSDWTVSGIRFGFGSFNHEQSGQFAQTPHNKFSYRFFDENLNPVTSILTSAFNITELEILTQPSATPAYKAELDGLSLNLATGRYYLGVMAVDNDVFSAAGWVTALLGTATGQTIQNGLLQNKNGFNLNNPQNFDLNFDFEILGTETNVSAVPLPASLPLVFTGLFAMGVMGRKNFRKTVTSYNAHS